MVFARFATIALAGLHIACAAPAAEVNALAALLAPTSSPAAFNAGNFKPSVAQRRARQPSMKLSGLSDMKKAFVNIFESSPELAKSSLAVAAALAPQVASAMEALDEDGNRIIGVMAVDWWVPLGGAIACVLSAGAMVIVLDNMQNGNEDMARMEAEAGINTQFSNTDEIREELDLDGKPKGLGEQLKKDDKQDKKKMTL